VLGCIDIVVVTHLLSDRMFLCPGGDAYFEVKFGNEAKIVCVSSFSCMQDSIFENEKQNFVVPLFVAL